MASSHVHVGWFLLGSMRVERDFQYWKRHEAPFASDPFVLEEYTRLFSAIEQLPQAHRVLEGRETRGKLLLQVAEG